ncbi:myo-inositol 2-dehydrogenase / D-chiro-inositol 1-dehydrogenase [Nocardioides terrae]|uniref:Myo-inositol 2-dehydrogenase / D-chiro-inositol 1-dehydrogenase n=1 Tax=Nocardioides terrae TaxID=574651 RepID=A0A1I1IQ46_9ACTN|nr:Gfo/Idh/MocA family oxidoreductase [Nocardioides terrae]SFC37822.1 myo-inositol 2-dehydrogenase / D-chiro-inositol 1-dehydrogenase [Nocardioides terrae]
MTGRLRVGVIGTGAMGAAHARTLSTSVAEVDLVAVHDLDAERAEALADELGAAASPSPEALVADVDAVVVASPDATHVGLVLAGLAAGRPMLCEKPLALDASGARRVVDAEVAAGRRLVQVGFTRRYDPAFRELKAVIDSGDLGTVRLVHAVHRNATNNTSTDDATLVTGSMIHELDTLPWLLDQPIAAVRVESPVDGPFRDPQLATVRFGSGALASVEVFVNARYGYDVQTEVVGTDGTASLEPRSTVTVRRAGAAGTPVRDDFVAHFADAYRLELAAWARAARAGTVDGPDAWDGYLANVAAEAGVRSLRSGSWEAVVPDERPELYRR